MMKLVLCLRIIKPLTYASIALFWIDAWSAELLHPDTPRFSAEQILNNDMPGRKASPKVEAKHDAEGFAQDRLYSVPEPGVHPRILFGPDDLPRLRQQFKDNPNAAWALKALRESVEQDLSNNDGLLRKAYQALVQGEMGKFEKIWNESLNPDRGGPPGSRKFSLSGTIADLAFLALIDGDKKQGEEVAKAVVDYANFMRPLIEKASKRPGAEMYWLQVRKVLGDGSGLGFMYDFAQPFMSPKQTEEVRSVIALATNGRYELGMDLPPHWVNWNFIGMALYYPLLALAIEGEEGYDPRIFERGRDVTKNYILYGNSSQGVGKEAIGYHTAGMTHTALMMLAMANRGDNLFTLERWRRRFDQWLIHTMQPYGGEWQSSGDLGTFMPNPSLVGAANFFFPKEERIAFVARNLPEPRKLNRSMGKRYLNLLLPPDSRGKKGKKQADELGSFGLSETFFDEERGLLIARTGWGKDDLVLQVTCRTDATFASHDHPDRGAFYLTAEGQPWAVSSMRMTEPKYLNQITIDGLGQGSYAPPGQWLQMDDSPQELQAVLDLKYCYDWKWMKTAFLATDEQFEKEPWLEWGREPRDRLLSRYPREVWERDPSPSVRAYYEGYMAGNPRMWGAEDSWVVRAPHNPVKKAFRSFVLSKQKHPYVLVVDDIQKDDLERLYAWRMRIPLKVEPYQMSDRDVVLGPQTPERIDSYNPNIPHVKTGRPKPQKGEPMLLVRVLQANQPSLPTRQDNLTVETLDFKKHDDTFQFEGRSMGMGKRLVIPSRSVEPSYKILLYPHRQGDPLPETKLSEDHQELIVEFPDQKDVYSLKQNQAGRTVIKRKS